MRVADKSLFDHGFYFLPFLPETFLPGKFIFNLTKKSDFGQFCVVILSAFSCTKYHGFSGLLFRIIPRLALLHGVIFLMRGKSFKNLIFNSPKRYFNISNFITKSISIL